MGCFGNKKSKQSPPSRTPSTFPSAPTIIFVSPPSYSYASYSAVPAVWPVQQQQQQQSFVAVSPYPVQPFQVPVPVPVPVQVVSPPTTTFAQSSPALTVMRQHTVTTNTPGPNTPRLCEVPSPRISHAISRRSHRARPQPQPELVQEYQLVPSQQQVVYSQQLQPQPQPQLQQPSPVVLTVNLVTTPQHTPGHVPAPLPPTRFVHDCCVSEMLRGNLSTDRMSNVTPPFEDDSSGGEEEDVQDSHSHHHHRRRHRRHHDLRSPSPMPSPNTLRVSGVSVSVQSPRPQGPQLSGLVTSTPLPQLPSSYDA